MTDRSLIAKKVRKPLVRYGRWRVKKLTQPVPRMSFAAARNCNNSTDSHCDVVLTMPQVLQFRYFSVIDQVTCPKKLRSRDSYAEESGKIVLPCIAITAIWPAPRELSIALVVKYAENVTLLAESSAIEPESVVNPIE